MALVLRLLLIVATVLLPPGTFQAATFLVTKTEDTNDGVCDSDCSLREAIEAANANAGPDDISVPAGDYLLTLGQLLVSDDVGVAGAGQASTIIDGNASDRVFTIGSAYGRSVATEISGVTIRNGMFRPPRGGGGILNYGTLTLTDSTLSGNMAPEDSGGGLYNFEYATATLVNSTVSRNTAYQGGGLTNGNILILTNSSVDGNYANGSGAGIHNEGFLTLTDSIVSDNTNSERSGGGISNGYGIAILIDSTVSGNSAGAGGGIFNNGPGVPAYVRLINSSVTGNSARAYGGGLYNSIGTLTLTNSTVSGNSTNYYGGGIDTDGDVTLSNSTVSGNTAAYGGGIATNEGLLRLTHSTVADNIATLYGGGISVRGFGDYGYAEIKNSILADNNAPVGANCGLPSIGSFTSLGYNLTDDTSCEFSSTGDLVVADAGLGPLADNGGPTETHALLADSPAIDTGSVDCPPPATDQRGAGRPLDGNRDGSARCDIGSVEFGSLVEIDIKPGGDQNRVNPRSLGVIPVALLGNADFDVTEVDVTTMAFGPDGAAPEPNGGNLQEASGDGFLDLVLLYGTAETGIADGDEEACLTGLMLDGSPFQGCDALRTVPAIGPGGAPFVRDATLYGVTGDGALASESLFILSQEDATPSFVGTLGNGTAGEAIASNPDDGLLYHASGQGLQNLDEIFETIDPDACCVTTQIVLSGDDYHEATALTYVGEDEFLLADVNGSLFRVGVDGVVSVVGRMDHRSKGLAVSGQVLYSVSRGDDLLREIDPSDGFTVAAVQITIPGVEIEGANGLAKNPTTGQLWALLRLELQDRRGRELVTIDPATGLATPIGNTANRFAGLAFVGGSRRAGCGLGLELLLVLPLLMWLYRTRRRLRAD